MVRRGVRTREGVDPAGLQQPSTNPSRQSGHLEETRNKSSMGNRARHRRLTGPPANRSPRGKAPHEKQSGGSSPRVKKKELSNKDGQSKGKANRARQQRRNT